MSWLSIALRNLLRNSRSVASTMLVLIVGLTALLIGGGFMFYTYDSLQEIAIRSEGHVILSDQNARERDNDSQRSLTLNTWQSIADQLLSMPGVLRILPRIYIEGLISHGDHSAAFFGTGVDPREEFRVHGPFLRITHGDVLNSRMPADELPEVMLGENLAHALHAQIGDVLRLRTLRLADELATIDARLVGTYRTGTEEQDKHSVMIHLDAARPLLASDNVSQLSVYLNQRQETESISQLIQRTYPALLVQTWHQRADLHDKVKALYDRIFGIMGAIIVIVVFLAITNTIGLALYQRRREIATLGALGTRPAQIYHMIVLEACLMAIIATMLGMLLAYATSSAINAMEVTMPSPPGKNEGYPLYIYASLYQYLSTSAALVAVTATASLLAAFRHARINIAEAMK